MPPRIQFREEEMREAIASFRRSAKELRDVAQQMTGISNVIEQGALVGQGGEAFKQSLSHTLNPAIERLAQKLEERARVAETELEQMLKAASQLR